MGSSPSGATKPSTGSHALTTFLKSIGSSAFYLNTIVVGLDAVERGHKKPDSINITWDPKDPAIAARMARRFAVESAIVRISDALEAYVGLIGVLPRFSKVKASWSKNAGKVDKLTTIAASLDAEAYLVSAGTLAMIWRNNIVHSGSRKLDAKYVRDLQVKADFLEANYGGLSVSLLLEHAERGKPTIKDASALISLSIKLCRNMDAMLDDNLSKEDILALIDHYKLVPSIEKIRRETSPDKVGDSIRRLISSVSPTLYNEFINHFAADGQDALMTRST